MDGQGIKNSVSTSPCSVLVAARIRNGTKSVQFIPKSAAQKIVLMEILKNALASGIAFLKLLCYGGGAHESSSQLQFMLCCFHSCFVVMVFVGNRRTRERERELAWKPVVCTFCAHFDRLPTLIGGRSMNRRKCSTKRESFSKTQFHFPSILIPLITAPGEICEFFTHQDPFLAPMAL